MRDTERWSTLYKATKTACVSKKILLVVHSVAHGLRLFEFGLHSVEFCAFLLGVDIYRRVQQIVFSVKGKRKGRLPLFR